MMKNFIVIFFVLFFCAVSAFAQGMDGAPVVFSDEQPDVIQSDEIPGEEQEYDDEFSDEDFIQDFEEFDAVSEEDTVRIVRSHVSSLPHRIFEMGFSFDADFSNNYFNADDFLVKDLVIDLKKMASDMPEKGFCLNLNMKPDFFLNLNLKSGVHVGLNFGIESYGNFTISKDLFDFFGYGNDLNEKITLDGKMNGDAFMFVDCAVGFDLFGFHLELIPAVYLPLIHATAENVHGSFVNDEKGGLRANASADIVMYTFTDMQPFFDGDVDVNQVVEAMKDGWGFDIASSLEHKIFNTLDGAVYSRIPIVPGQLNYSTKMTMTASMEVDELKNMFEDGDDGLQKDFDVSDKEYNTASYNLHRPLRMGAQVAWRPFGKWCTFGGLLGFGVKQPFTSDAYGYPEYTLSIDIDLFIKNWNMLGLRLSSAYLDEVFKHNAGFIFNLRAFELDLGVCASGGSFTSSFKGAGAGAYLMVAFGW